MRIGTLDGVLCSTEAMGVLFVGIVQSSPKAHGMKMYGSEVEDNPDTLTCKKICCSERDSGCNSLVDIFNVVTKVLGSVAMV